VIYNGNNGHWNKIETTGVCQRFDSLKYFFPRWEKGDRLRAVLADWSESWPKIVRLYIHMSLCQSGSQSVRHSAIQSVSLPVSSLSACLFVQQCLDLCLNGFGARVTNWKSSENSTDNSASGFKTAVLGYFKYSEKESNICCKQFMGCNTLGSIHR